MSRCVCSHIKALHKNGVCQARINPCGCRQFETERAADQPGTGPIVGDKYSGFYAGKRYTA